MHRSAASQKLRSEVTEMKVDATKRLNALSAVDIGAEVVLGGRTVRHWGPRRRHEV